jgi:cytochrome c oxidase subunit 3
MLATNATANLAHHFEDLDQQHEAATLGMWVFLATELMVFGGLFAGYTVYRVAYPEAFERASQKLNVFYGGLNTLVLLTSSLTMALAVWAIQTGRQRLLTYFLASTVALGTAFLVVKGFEYFGDYEDRLMPFLPGGFDPSEWHAGSGHEQEGESGGWKGKEGKGETREDPNVDPGTNSMPIEMHVFFAQRVRLFYAFYYIMTGLHALHLIIGIVLLWILTVLASRGRFNEAYYSPVEVTGLYWHFVDVVWIFLLPLLYLVGTVQPHP